MKQNKKIKKSIITVASIIFTGSLFTNTSSHSVMAAPIPSLDTSKIVPMYVDPTKFESLKMLLAPNVLNANKSALDKYLGYSNYTILSHYIALEKRNKPNGDIEPIYSVTLDGTAEHQYLDNETMGSTTLKNPNKKSMVMNSLSFSRAIANTVTSSNTYGFKVGTEASGKIGIPLVAEGSVKLSAEFNFAHQDTTTTTDTVTYTVPSQSVEVPAGGEAEVTASLKMVKTKGKVKLSTLYEGFYATTIQLPDRNRGVIVGLGEWTKLVKQTKPNIEKGLIYVDKDKAKLEGAGAYEALYGANVMIEIKLKDKNGQPAGNYTTEVTPQIIKSK